MDNEPDCYEKHSKCSAVEHCVAMDLTGNYKRDTVFRTVSCTNEECLVICEKGNAVKWKVIFLQAYKKLAVITYFLHKLM